MQRRYGYNPGDSDEFIRGTENNKIFARVDFNLGQQSADGPSQLRRRLQRRRHAEQRHLQVPRQLLSLPQPDELDRRPVELELRSEVQRVPCHLSAHPRLPHDRYALSASHRTPSGWRPIRGRHRAVLHRERAGSGHLRAHQRSDDGPRDAHDHARHTQRVLQVPESLHQGQLRHLRVREPRYVRGRQRTGCTTTASRRPAIRSLRRNSRRIRSASTRAISGGCARTSR